jgi:hypothetical protein
MSFRGQLCDDCARGTLPADAVLVHACELFRFLPENNKLSFSLVVIIIITFANNITISFFRESSSSSSEVSTIVLLDLTGLGSCSPSQGSFQVLARAYWAELESD